MLSQQIVKVNAQVEKSMIYWYGYRRDLVCIFSVTTIYKTSSKSVL